MIVTLRDYIQIVEGNTTSSKLQVSSLTNGKGFSYENKCIYTKSLPNEAMTSTVHTRNCNNYNRKLFLAAMLPPLDSVPQPSHPCLG